VATKIVVDDPMFIPQYKTDGAACVDLVANIKEGEIRIPHRGVAEIDCGFSMEVKPGYRVAITGSDKTVQRGDWVSSIKTNEFRVCVSVYNIGRENPLTIRHGELFAQMTIEPVLLFDFMPSFPSQI
jgi:dUTPase